MGEEAAAGAPKAVGTPPVRKGMPSNVMMMVAGGVVLLVVLMVIGILLKPSFSGKGSSAEAQSKYVPVFTKLELKEAAEIRDALEAKGIKDYKIEENGRTISILRKEADNARLTMAIEGLPSGGGVGYEIFDKGGALGATDFDKRIKLVRALNGELSRNIARITGVEEARVQIVMPEKQLFETKKVPVTSAVFIRTIKGFQLAPLQVKGIVHLISSSVEELMTENVTIVDNTGRILNNDEYADYYSGWLEKQEQEKALLLAGTKKGKAAIAEIEAIQSAVKPAAKLNKKDMTPQEKMEARLRYKNEMEKNLESKAQVVLDQFFPAGSSMMKVNVELKTFDEAPADDNSSIAALTSIILLDEDNKLLVLTPEMQEAVLTAMSAVTGFVRGRDRMDVRWAPLSRMASAALQGKLGAENQKKAKGLMVLADALGGQIVVYVLLFVAGIIGYSVLKKKRTAESESAAAILSPDGRGAGDFTGLQGPSVDDFRDAALKNPEKLADALKTWLTEA